jgi:hypothetical protein
MTAEPGDVTPATSPVPAWMTRALWGIIALSAIFACLIFVIPLDAYRMAGNYFEIVVAVFCMTCCLYAFRYISGQVLLLLAAFAFFSYALSNAFWYFYTLAFGRSVVYTTIAEFGFLCFFLFFIAAFSIGSPDGGMRLSPAVGLLVLFLSIPVAIIWVGGDNQPVRLGLLLFRFFLIEQLVAVTIRHGIYRHIVLFTGISLYCLSSMLYGIRETLLIIYPVTSFSGNSIMTPSSLYDFMSVVGPMFICSMALIQLGLFAYLSKEQDCLPRQVA